jgi:hypothetical protein
MQRHATWNLARRLILPLALLAAAGCVRCGAPGAGKAAEAAAPAEELATLDLPGLPPAGPERDQLHVEAYANEDGTGGAFVVRTQEGARLVYRRTVSPAYPGMEQVTISPDGRRVAFVVPSGERRRVVLDGEPGEELDAVEGLVFTRDGRHLAYKARLGETWRLAVDRSLGEARAAIPAGPRVAANGASIVVAERAAAGAPLAVASYDAGLRRAVLRELDALELHLSERATTAAAVVEAGGKRKVVAFALADPGALRDGPACDEISWVGFDGSGAHVLYGARLAGRDLFVVDGRSEPIPAPSREGQAVFNPSRGNAALALEKDGAFLHLAFDRKAAAPARYERVADPAFSPDGNRLAYVAQRAGRDFVVLGSVEGPPLDRVVGPRFSPDGRFLVYRARKEGARFVMVTDATGRLLARHPDYEQVLPPVFTSDGSSVAYAAKDGPRLLWRIVKLSP